MPPVLVVLFVIGSAACSRTTIEPTAPSDLASSPATGNQAAGQIVNAVAGGPVSGVRVQANGLSEVTSDASGLFQLPAATPGQYSVRLTDSAFIERQTWMRVPAPQLTLSLIPANFDLVAFDQMARSNNSMIVRWTSAPALVVQNAELQFTRVSDGDFVATANRVNASEADSIVSTLSNTVSALTGGAFPAFSKTTIASAQAGDRVSVKQAGVITVARFRGLLTATGMLGFGDSASTASGEIVSATIYLDADYDKSGPSRLTVRMHEFGHALGFAHVTNRDSVMNPNGQLQPTAFDRLAAAIAYARAPGNRSPDVDPAPGPASLTASTIYRAGSQ